MISIELSARFKKCVRRARREREVTETLQQVTEGFDKPHVHSGLGIRKLGTQVYECRTSRDWRLIFVARKGTLTFDFGGDHKAVQNYLRGQI